jgi:hypothetical protein
MKMQGGVIELNILIFGAGTALPAPVLLALDPAVRLHLQVGLHPMAQAGTVAYDQG